MKKYIVMILTVLMLLSLNIVSFAAYLGDINADGKITASDARTILRISAKLEKPDDEKIVFADVNTDGRITASDARTVLRMSARLEPLREITTKEPETQPTTEPVTAEPTTKEPVSEETTTEEPTTAQPEEEITYPEIIETFLSGEYYISGKTHDNRQVKIAVSADDAELAIASGNAQLSLMKKKEKTFIKAITSDGKKYYVRYNDLMKELFGSDFESITSRFNFAAYSEKKEVAVKTGFVDGVSCVIFSFKNDGSYLDFYVADEKVLKIENITDEGKVSAVLTVAEMSGKIPADMLKIRGFTATGISYIPYVLPEFFDVSDDKPAVKTYPRAVEVFLQGKYHMTGTLYDGDMHSFGFTSDGTDKNVTLDGISYFIRKGVRYIRNSGMYAQVTDAQLTGYGIDFNKVMNDNTFVLEGKTESIAFEKSVFDGLPCDIYTLRDKNGNVMKLTIVFERLARIAVLDKDGNEVKYIVLDEFDDDIPDGILTLVGYKKSDLAKILG